MTLYVLFPNSPGNYDDTFNLVQLLQLTVASLFSFPCLDVFVGAFGLLFQTLWQYCNPLWMPNCQAHSFHFLLCFCSFLGDGPLSAPGRLVGSPPPGDSLCLLYSVPCFHEPFSLFLKMCSLGIFSLSMYSFIKYLPPLFSLFSIFWAASTSDAKLAWLNLWCFLFLSYFLTFCLFTQFPGRYGLPTLKI